MKIVGTFQSIILIIVIIITEHFKDHISTTHVAQGAQIVPQLELRYIPVLMLKTFKEFLPVIIRCTHSTLGWRVAGVVEFTEQSNPYNN